MTDPGEEALIDLHRLLFVKLVVKMVSAGQLTQDDVLAAIDAARDEMRAVGDPSIPPVIARPIDDAEAATYAEAAETARARVLRAFELEMAKG